MTKTLKKLLHVLSRYKVKDKLDKQPNGIYKEVQTEPAEMKNEIFEVKKKRMD